MNKGIMKRKQPIELAMNLCEINTTYLHTSALKQNKKNISECETVINEMMEMFALSNIETLKEILAFVQCYMEVA